MNTNKIIVICSLIVILLIVSVPTGYKVIKNHHESLYKVVEEKIIDASKKCYYEENCLDEEITLKKLYDLGYIEKVSNPVTKEYYNENSFVLKKNNKFEFIEKE